MRNTNLSHLALTACVLAFWTSCGGGDHPKSGGADAHTEDDGHDHGSKGSDDHSADDEHEQGGEVHELGSVTAAGTTLSVTAGHVDAGAEVEVELGRSSGAVPAGIRVWIGLESGVGSMKVKADPHGDHFHAHVEVPKVLQTEARLWVQVESASGTSETQGVALPSEDHKK